MTFTGKIQDTEGATKETITLEADFSRRDQQIIFLVWVKELRDEQIVERLYCATYAQSDALSIAAAINDESPDWQGCEPIAEVTPMPLITFAEWQRRNLVEKAKAKLSQAELEALYADFLEGMKP